MSWMQKNYHIASLAGGVLVLAGLGYMAQSKATEIQDNFQIPGGKKKDTTTVEGTEAVAETITSLSGANPVKAPVTPGGRTVDLLTSVDLFIKDGDTSKLIDLLQEADIHPPIPNKWWVENRVDPTWLDSPMQDKDGDGFFNGEEYKAGTDPSDPTSFAGLINKLEVVSVKSDLWFLDFSGVIGKGTQFKFQYKPDGGTLQENRIPAAQQLAIGEFFFAEGPGQRRFKLLKVEGEQVQKRFGPANRDFAFVEDQRPNKKGTVYKIPYRIERAEKLEHTHFDHTVTFRLNAVGKSGDNFDVEENGTFEITSGDEKIQCKLVGIKLDQAQLAQGKVQVTSVVVEYDGGKTIEVPAN